MSLSGKHGIVNMEKSSEDEPTFILRAQDELAESIIEIYRSLAAYHGGLVQDGLNKHTFLRPARRDNKE